MIPPRYRTAQGADRAARARTGENERVKLWMKVGLLLVLALLVAGVAGGMWLRTTLTRPHASFAGDEVFVEIPAGESTAGSGRRLVEAGVLRDELTFRLAWRWYGSGRTLKAGEYRFTGASTPAEVLDRVARGDVYLLAITFPEGLTAEEMGEVFARAGFGTAEQFVQAAASPDAIRALDPEADTLEGYLFPDTYRVPRSTTADSLVASMVARFTQVFDAAWADAANARGLSVRQLVTLASLVEKETARAEERGQVAGVYHNRLRVGMPMQCDPTVIYALKRAGRWDGNITRADLQFDSPYNTYRYPGLPPGPIAQPGRASLAAAARPDETSALYFVSRNDGSHVFSDTLEEHNRAVREWQIEYFRRQRQQGGR